MLVLLLLLDATRFRRPETWRRRARSCSAAASPSRSSASATRWSSAIETHNFAVGHDFTNHAVEQALTKGTANVLGDYLDLLAGLALAAGMIAAMINALRVGLLPRWMGILGIFTGVLIFLPIGGAELQVVPAFWLVMMGILYMGRWPNGEPPAWAAGEARPWPSQAQMRAEARAANGAPAPASGRSCCAARRRRPVSGGSSRKRRRKRARAAEPERRMTGSSAMTAGDPSRAAPPSEPGGRGGLGPSELGALLEVERFEPPPSFASTRC